MIPANRAAFLTTLAAGRLRLQFQRTLRLPDDGRSYPLPPGLGELPLLRVADYAKHLPQEWSAGPEPTHFLPLYRHEALFLAFQGEAWKPIALKVGVGGINAISGAAWEAALPPEGAGEQDYMVCPPQPWLDGIHAQEGRIRQFVATPLGAGHSVEAQVTGEERQGGIQIAAFDPRPGHFPDEPPAREKVFLDGSLYDDVAESGWEGMADAGGAMGLGAGGQMEQKIYPDPYGRAVWQETPSAVLRVYLIDAEAWTRLTGETLPTPTQAEFYTAKGMPWFALNDAAASDVAVSPVLAAVQSVSDLPEAGKSVRVPAEQVKTIPLVETPAPRPAAKILPEGDNPL